MSDYFLLRHLLHWVEIVTDYDSIEICLLIKPYKLVKD